MAGTVKAVSRKAGISLVRRELEYAVQKRNNSQAKFESHGKFFSDKKYYFDSSNWDQEINTEFGKVNFIPLDSIYDSLPKRESIFSSLILQ